MTVGPLAALFCSVTAVFAGAAACADDSLSGAYLGGGIGPSWVKAATASLPSLLGAPTPVGDFDETHTGYQLVLGARPTGSPLALELEYLDLGEPHLPPYAGPGFLYGTVSQRGEGLFLLYYLPIPLIEPYLKAGASRITTHANFAYCPVDTCVTATPSSTNNALAVGAGLQWTLGRFAVRGEYEHFNAGGGHPGLLTIGATWTFL